MSTAWPTTYHHFFSIKTEDATWGLEPFSLAAVIFSGCFDLIPKFKLKLFLTLRILHLEVQTNFHFTWSGSMEFWLEWVCYFQPAYLYYNNIQQYLFLSLSDVKWMKTYIALTSFSCIDDTNISLHSMYAVSTIRLTLRPD